VQSAFSVVREFAQKLQFFEGKGKTNYGLLPQRKTRRRTMSVLFAKDGTKGRKKRIENKKRRKKEE